ncbi:PREDICTED: uncharacterized protein LOC105460126 [Wasmannia auropunctata]|uniref:uncharacterized protein LOC105460126 n=1 Tax=Wasmannia auropunctata TaxID=64793 RepID=UPI0005F0B867|nr:PREDICTED: uncharacterized protein LOC105460126 [Wasmannia auropunctata]
MRKKNLLPRVKASKQNPCNESPATETAVSIRPTNNIEIALNWLKNFHEPWNKVEEKWTVTSKYRRDVLIASRSQAKERRTESMKAAAYLDDYKVLRLSHGYTLIEIDFVISCQPGFEDALITNWSSFIQKIDSILKNSSFLIKDPEGKMLRQLYFKTTNKEAKDILLMQCLSSLLPPSRQVQLGTKKFKPTIKESRDAFIVNVKIPGQVVNFITERREKICNQFGRSASVQPYILYVGKEQDVIDEVLVVIDNFCYKLESFQHALDVCFKTFFVLDIVFTAQCDHVWLLIQKALYGFTTTDDINILKVTSFLKKLELMDKEN